MSRKTNKMEVEYFLKINKPELEKRYGVVKEINAGSFRIAIKNKRIDYYPSSGKYHDIIKDERGECPNWFENILVLFE